MPLPQVREPVRRVTLREVAREVGVSICTASVVLNGSSSGSHISEKTRGVLIDAAKRMGYRPNRIARTLQDGRTHTVGLIPTAVHENILLGPHLQLILNSTANTFRSVHYDLLLITRTDPSDANAILDVILDGRIDGAILVSPRSGSQLVQLLQQERFPFVVVDSEPDPTVCSFGVDNVSGVKLAMQHLQDLGHRQIAHISGQPALAASRIRTQTFIEEAGDLPDHWIQDGELEAEAGAEAMHRILAEAPLPTAVFCANDEMAIGAMRAAAERGLSVPGDISIVGFDDAPPGRFLRPGLTTVRHPIEAISAAASQKLYDLIQGDCAITNETFRCELVVRGSTAPPRKPLS